MKEFTNPKAIELLEEAKALEDFVASKEKELERSNGPWPDIYLDMLAQAAAFRSQADDIEDGLEDA